jgi:hypothetical protein
MWNKISLEGGQKIYFPENVNLRQMKEMLFQGVVLFANFVIHSIYTCIYCCIETKTLGARRYICGRASGHVQLESQ